MSPLSSRRRWMRQGLTLGLGAAAFGAAPWMGRAAHAAAPGPTTALIVIDVQNCFLPGGTLPVKEGDAVVPVINRLASQFQNIIVTQDWHTPDHASFASSHPERKPFELIDLPYGKQVLWPAHCIQGTPDAELAPGLKLPTAQMIVRKGYHRSRDSYSAFLEADHSTPTGLAGALKERGINEVFLCGLATDFCVAWSALDARKLGFSVRVIEDATRAIDLNGSLEKAWKDMTAAGVQRIQSASLLAT